MLNRTKFIPIALLAILAGSVTANAQRGGGGGGGSHGGGGGGSHGGGGGGGWHGGGGGGGSHGGGGGGGWHGGGGGGGSHGGGGSYGGWHGGGSHGGGYGGYGSHYGNGSHYGSYYGGHYGKYYGGHGYYGGHYGYGHGHYYGGYYPYWGLSFGYGWPYYYGSYYPYSYGYGYPAYTATVDSGGSYDSGRALSSEIETDVSPSSATVYLDGNPVGIADDFNGYPQKLHVEPGSHELIFQEAGYQTLRMNVQTLPYHAVKIKEHLVTGQDPEPPAGSQQYERGSGSQPYHRESGSVPPERGSGTYTARGGEQQSYTTAGHFDRHVQPTLSVDVTPPDASVYVDGNQMGDGSAHYVLDLQPGRHRLEVAKPGFQVFSAEVVVQPGQQQEMAVRLVRQRGEGGSGE